MQRLRIVWGFVLVFLAALNAIAEPDYHGPNFSVINDVTAVAGQEVVVPVQALDVDDNAPAYRYDIDGGDGWEYDFDRQALVWVPDESETLPARLKVTAVSDGINWGTQFFWLDFGEPNYHPEVVLAQSPMPVVVGQEFQYQVTATDLNANDSLSYRIFHHPVGMQIDETTGLVTWTPQAGDLLDTLFTVEVTDANGGIVYQRIRTESLQGRVFPEIEPIPTQYVAIGETLYFQITPRQNGSENNLRYGISHSPDGFSFDRDAGVMQWTPTAEQEGHHRFALGFSNEFGANSVYFSVVVGNPGDSSPPVVHSDTFQIISSGSLFQFQVNAESLLENRTPFTFYLSDGPDGASIDANGQFSWTPTNNQSGTHRFTVEVRDTENNLSKQVYLINVDNGNFLPEILTASLPQYNPGELYSPSVVAADKNPADELFYYFDCAPEGATIDKNTGVISWLPTEEVNGEKLFCVSVVDTHNDRTRQYFHVYIDKPNTPPRLIPEELPTLVVGQPFTHQFNVVDPDGGDIVEFKLVYESLGMEVDSSGLFSWTPTADQVGWHSFKVGVYNPYPFSQTDYRYFYVKVEGDGQENPENQSPSVISVPAATSMENQLYTYVIDAIDPDGDELTYTLNNSPQGMILQDNTLSWTPTYEQAGTYDVVISVSDNINEPVNQTYSLTINNVNRVPSATASYVMLNEDESIEVSLNASDSDGDTLIYQVTQLPQKGVLSGDGPNLTYTPYANEAGVDSFAFYVSDGSADSEVATVQLSITSVNDMPIVVSSPPVIGQENGQYSYELSIDDIDSSSFTFNLVSSPAGMVVSSEGVISWLPDFEAEGDHSIVVEVSDGTDSVTHGYTLNIVDTNRAPVISSYPSNVVVQGEDWIYLVDALDPDGDSISVSVDISEGVAINPATLEVTWDTENVSLGEHSLNVTVSDSQGGSVNQSLSVDVLPANTITNYEGKEFWLSISNNANNNADGMLTIYLISPYQDTSASVSIPLLNVVENIQLIEGQVASIDISLSEMADAGGALLNQLVADSAVHVESEADIVVYGINQGPYSTDGYSVIPLDSLGTEYIVGQFRTSKRNADDQSPIVDIVATEDDTVVNIDAVMDLFIGPVGSEVRIPTGTVHTLAMNKGDVFKLQAKSSYKADLSGTSITSNRKIAVFANHSSVALPISWADFVIEQMPPVDALGTEYFSAPFYATSGDTYRIIATKDNTAVYTNEVLVAKLNSGEAFNFISREAQFVKANNPIMLLHFMSSASYSSDSSRIPQPNLPYGVGDPSMVLLGSVENYLSSYTVSSPQTDLAMNFVNIVISDSAASTLLLDGVAIDSSTFVAIGNTGYSYIQLEVEPGSHHVSADEPFGLVIYGYDAQNSYAYSGGMALGNADLVSSIEIDTASIELNAGNEACVSAIVTDSVGRALQAVPVKFEAGSLHTFMNYQLTSVDGVATHCYLGYQLGTDQVNVSVNEVVRTANIQWNAVEEENNVAPVIISDPVLSFVRDETYLYQVEAIDLNNDDLTYELAATNDSVVISPDGLIEWETNNFSSRHISWWRAGQTENVAEKRTAAVPVDLEVIVTDSVGNQAVQKFQLNEYQAFNESPKYEVDSPNPFAVVGIRYIYDPEYIDGNANNWGYRLHVTDYDGDKIYTSLLNGPSEASLTLVCDELVGIQEGDPSCAYLQRWIEWTPTAEGTETFEFEISDSRGSAVLTQRFDVEVFENIPVGLGAVPCEGQYSIVAGSDFLCLLNIINDIPVTTSSNLDNVRIVFEQRPTYLRESWVQIGDGTATIQLAWAPSAANVGDHVVRFYIEDQVSRTETFEFTISVTDGNQSPTFDRYHLNLDTEASILLSYQLNANDPDGDPLVFGAVTVPEGMSVSTDGLVTWEPSLDLTQTNHRAIFSVTDGNGGYDYLPTGISVTSLINQAPHFVSNYIPRTAKVGVEYQASFAAEDREGHPVSYVLDSRIPTSSEAMLSGNASYSIVPTEVGRFYLGVMASDGQLYRWKSAYIDVLDPDDSANQLSATIIASPRVIEPDETITISVNPTNLASTPMITYTAGAASFPSTSSLAMEISGAELNIGENIIAALVTDGYETVQLATTVYVSDPEDDTAPELTIHSPELNAVVTAPTDIVVSATDNVVEYVVSYRRIDSDYTVELARGEATGDIVEQNVATFDPSLLVNGTYLITFQATDANGVTSITGATVIVEGQLKVGHFSMTVEDLVIPLEGISIRLTRTYDSRLRDELLDFGYGWYPDYQAIRLNENDEPTKGWSMYFSDSELFEIETPAGTTYVSMQGTCTESGFQKTVTITLPDGKVEKFGGRARPISSGAVSVSNPNCYLAGDRHVQLEFVALGNTQSTLTTPEGNLYLSQNGSLVIDPSDSSHALVSNYVLTTKAGYKYYINQDSGIQRIIDNNGNEITYTVDGVSHSSGKSITFERDLHGRIEYVRAPGDITIQYHYDANGDLIAVSDPVAYKTPESDNTRYTYNSGHYLNEIFDALDRKALKNLYDEAGRLYGQEHSDGTIKVFDHNVGDRSSAVTDMDGRTTIFNYDDRGNVLEEIKVMSNGSDIVTTFAYDEHDNQVSKAIGGSIWTTLYDENNNLQYTENPEGNRVRYEDYNGRGQETKIYDELDRLTEIIYDPSGNLEAINMPLVSDVDSNSLIANSASNIIENGRVLSTTDLRGQSTTYTYYPSGHPWVGQKWTETSDQLGMITYTYDERNNIKFESRERSVDGLVVTETIEYEYDERNRLIVTRYPDNTYTQTDYDLAGSIDKERDRFGVWTDYAYDVYGRLILTEFADGSTEERAYSREGLLEAVVDRQGHTTSYEYDDAGRLWRTIFDDGSYTEIQYTPQGWVRYEWDEERNLTEYAYDLAGRRISVIHHNGGEQINHSYTYYDNGELHTETDALTQTTTYLINELDQRIETQFHNGTSIEQRYDAMGARTRQIDQNGIVTDYRYDDLGRLYQVQPDVEIDGERVPNTTYTYDEVGNKLSQTDANGHVTRWTYDYFGRVLTRKLPLGQTESFEYDDANRRVTHTDFNGNYSITQNDVMGRVESMTYYLADGTERASESYTYYNNDQVHTVTDKHGVTEYGYDSRDRLEWLIQPDGVRFDYDYDLVGNRTQVKVTRGTEETVVDYTYDDLNRLETVVDANGTTTYAYYDNGNLFTVTYPNGVVTEYQYNAVNQLEVLTTRDAQNNILTSYTYGLDNTGRREDITEANGRFTDYVYDDLYRLTDEIVTDPINGDYSANYQYDWVGNRIYETVDGVSTAYRYDDNDRLEQQGGTIFVYDDNGNTLTETLDGVVTTYTYDEKNLLASVEKASVITDYTYNHNGIRTSKTESGITTNFIVDENRDYAQVLQEVESDSVQVHYTYGHDLINQERAGVESYYLYDGLGSTRALADSAGAITDTYFYEAFGDVLAETGDTENDYQFTGEQYDSSLDMTYLRARYYNQDIGRFTSMDTWAGRLHQPITLNKYLYADADPGNMTDPTGNFSIGSVMTGINVMGRLAMTAVNTYSNVSLLMDVAQGNVTASELAFAFFATKFLPRKLFKCNSFQEGTMVLTENGLTPIEDIQIGD
ncbi:MAG: putative Ig domain-containing protein, partial [Pseudomonadales bacterium]|nr:putative Ig domain-containing protein [Pseudomonadales bacterium]